MVRFPAGTEEFSLLHSVQTSSGIHPVCYPGDLSLEVKQLGHDPSSAEVKNMWSYNYISPINLRRMVFN
jgi:hypothetical protein